MRRNKITRTVLSCGIALLLGIAPVCTYAADETEPVDYFEDVLEGETGLLDALTDDPQALADAAGAAHEGYAEIVLGEAMKEMLSQQASGEDFSWLQSAKLFVQGTPSDLELTFNLNGTDLYHLILSVDMEEKALYALCPELKEQAVRVPINDLLGNTMSQFSGMVPPEVLVELLGLGGKATELIASIPAEKWQQEAATYLTPVVSRLASEEGTKTITAGKLSAEVATQTFGISSEDMQALIPELLTLLSEDEIVKQVVTSDFAESALKIVGKVSGSSYTGQDLLDIYQNTLRQVAEGDFSNMMGFSVTVGRYVQPEESEAYMDAYDLEFDLEQGGMTADICDLTAIAETTEESSEHAAEFKLGEVAATSANLATESFSILAEGSFKEVGMLDEDLSVIVDGNASKLAEIRDLDFAALAEGKINAKITIYTDDGKIDYIYSTAEDGGQAMEFLIDDASMFTFTSNVVEVESTQIDPIDKENAFTISSKDELFEYLRDAGTVAMIEKLKTAGVPEHLVDQLTGNEAGTESSKENKDDAEAAEEAA